MEYYVHDYLKFEGEFLNDKKNGRGKNIIMVLVIS